jgi:6-phosphogluconolactonase (cycloisomerase 2 family)
MKIIIFFIITLFAVSCSKNISSGSENQPNIESNLAYIQSSDLSIIGDFDFGTVANSVTASKKVVIKNIGTTAGKVKIDISTILQSNGIFTINYSNSDCFIYGAYKVLQPQYSCQVELLLDSGSTTTGSIFAAIPLYDELASNALIKNLQVSVVISSTGTTPASGKSCITSYHKDLITGKCVSDYKDCSTTVANAVIAKKTWSAATSSYGTCLVSSCVPNYSPTSNELSCELSKQAITINKIIDQGITNIYDTSSNSLIGTCSSSTAVCQVQVNALSNIRIESIGSCGYNFVNYADANCIGSNYLCSQSSIKTDMTINPTFVAQTGATGYHVEGLSCVSNSKIVSCPTLSIANAAYNTNMDTYTSIWNGLAYSTTANTYTTNTSTACGYQCKSGYSTSDGGLSCVAVFSADQSCSDSLNPEVTTPDGKYSFVYGDQWTLSNNYITYKGWIQMNIKDSQSGITFDNGQIVVPYGIKDIIISPDGKNVYVDTIYPSDPGLVLNGSQAFPTGTKGKLWAYSVNSSGKLDLIGSYVVGSQPRGMTISPDGTSLYVSSYGTTLVNSVITMFVRSTTTGLLSYNKEQTIDGTGSLSGTACMAISPDGSKVYLEGSPLVEYNRHSSTGLLSLAATQEACIATSCGYQCDSNFYRTNISGQTCSETTTPELALSYSKTPIVVAANGLYAYKTNQQYTTSGTTATYKGWIQSYIRDTSSGKIFKAGTTTTKFGFGGIALAPDNKTLYITNYFPSDPGAVTVGSSAFPTGTNGIITPLYIDTTTGSLTVGTELPTQSQPRVPAVSQDSLFVYVPNAYNQTISKFTMPTLGSFQETTQVVSSSILSTTGAAAVSSDNRYLYIEGSTATVDFSRHQTTGNLTTPRLTCGSLPANAVYNPGMDTYTRVWNGTSYNVTSPTFTTSAVDCSYQCAVGYNSTDGGITCSVLYNPIPQLALTKSSYVITPNGKYAYSFANSYVTDTSGLRTFSAQIQKYDRDATTGILYPGSTIATVYGANTMAISPDGKNLSISSQWSSTPSPAQTGVTIYTAGTKGIVSNFSINSSTGDLTLVDKTTVGSLPQGIAFSPDGTSLYVVNSYTSTRYISILNRNITTGAISNNSTFTVSSAITGSTITVSPDSTRVYMMYATGSYYEFIRLPSTGALSLNKSFTTWP